MRKLVDAIRRALFLRWFMDTHAALRQRGLCGRRLLDGGAHDGCAGGHPQRGGIWSGVETAPKDQLELGFGWISALRSPKRTQRAELQFSSSVWSKPSSGGFLRSHSLLRGMRNLQNCVRIRCFVERNVEQNRGDLNRQLSTERRYYLRPFLSALLILLCPPPPLFATCVVAHLIPAPAPQRCCAIKYNAGLVVCSRRYSSSSSRMHTEVMAHPFA